MKIDPNKVMYIQVGVLWRAFIYIKGVEAYEEAPTKRLALKKLRKLLTK